MRTQAHTLAKVKRQVNYTVMTPPEAAQALAEKLGFQGARETVRQLIVEVEHDVAEWDYWTDVRLWLLH